MEYAVKKLNRFTTLPILLDLLQRKKLKEIFAVCLSFGDETIHHWKSYSGGSSGCVIEFDAKKLLSFVDRDPYTIHRKIEYQRLRGSAKWKLNTTIDDIPFNEEDRVINRLEFR